MIKESILVNVENLQARIRNLLNHTSASMIVKGFNLMRDLEVMMDSEEFVNAMSVLEKRKPAVFSEYTCVNVIPFSEFQKVCEYITKH